MNRGQVAGLVQSESVFPAGFIVGNAGTTTPDGWLPCDGRSLAVAGFARLFAAIGYTYGGSGPLFNVPNGKGRVLVMQDSGVTAFATLGGTGGSRDAAQVAHSHVVNAHGHSFAAASTHGHSFAAESPGTNSVEPPNHMHVGTTNGHTHTNGGGTVFMNCNAVHGHQGGCNQASEAASGGGCTNFGCNLTTTSNGDSYTTAGVNTSISHSHTVNSHGHSFAADGGHGHSFNTAESPGTSAPGVSATDANLVPYLVVPSCMIKT
jgi:microcystin-dependent protein